LRGRVTHLPESTHWLGRADESRRANGLIDAVTSTRTPAHTRGWWRRASTAIDPTASRRRSTLADGRIDERDLQALHQVGSPDDVCPIVDAALERQRSYARRQHRRRAPRASWTPADRPTGARS